MTTVQMIPVALIDPNPDQPRKTFERALLLELGNSIKESGLLQPITVRPVGGRFEIVAGERRWRAHQAVGLTEIRALVSEMNVAERDINAIIENLQRVDVPVLEEALAYQRLLDQGWSKEDLARKVGKMVWRIEEAVNLLNVLPEYRQLLQSGQLSVQQCRELCRHSERDQRRLFNAIKNGAASDFAKLRILSTTLLDEAAQVGMFGDAESGKVTDHDHEAISALERKVEAIASMVAGGFNKDGGIEIAKKVAPHRAKDMADKLDLIQAAIAHLTKDLRRAAAQLELAA